MKCKCCNNNVRFIVKRRQRNNIIERIKTCPICKIRFVEKSQRPSVKSPYKDMGENGSFVRRKKRKHIRQKFYT